MNGTATRRILQDATTDLVSLSCALLGDAELETFVDEASDSCVRSLESGQTIMIAGNGGSFADSIHMAAEFTGRLLENRKALPAIALGSNPSSLTAIGNDYGFTSVFRREFEAFATQDSTVIVFSTSGNSENVIELLDAARERQVPAFGLLGNGGGKCLELSRAFVVKSSSTARIQEIHMHIAHAICFAVEAKLGYPTGVRQND